MTSEIEIKIRGYHVDMYGHVNNARYLEFLEEARWQWVENRGSMEQITKSELGFSVVNINIDYRRPALFGDTLVLETSLKSTGTKSGVMHQVVRFKDKPDVAAQADVTFVVVSMKTGRPVELDDELLGKLGLDVAR